MRTQDMLPEELLAFRERRKATNARYREKNRDMLLLNKQLDYMRNKTSLIRYHTIKLMKAEESES